jgi:lipopolysaccharide/colanic/teichoic acid biosynthesis glycosyltransferase
MKRCLDVVLSVLGLIVLAPIGLLIAAAIRIDTPGAVFYRGRRAGRDGRAFGMLKFRTMRTDAPVDGPALTLLEDGRVTRVGRWLRRRKLDELPQLVNVIRGEMSLVGPRPEDPRYVARYSAEQRRLLVVRPGITSAASLKYWNESDQLTGSEWEQRYCEAILPHKLSVELEYLERASLRHDLAIAMLTLLRLIGIGWPTTTTATPAIPEGDTPRSPSIHEQRRC